MKRLVMCIALAHMLLNAAVAQCDFRAATEEGVLLGYVLNADGATVSVAPPEREWPYYSGTKPGGRVTVPERVEWQGRSYAVTAVGRNAFYRCDSLAEVRLPQGVTRIGTQAFNGCTALVAIGFGDSLVEVGEGAFAYCRGIDTLRMPPTVVRIGISAFAECTGLRYVEMSEAQWRLANSTTFSGCPLLKNGGRVRSEKSEKQKK